MYAKAKKVTPAIAWQSMRTQNWCLCWTIGPRDAETARDFKVDILGRMKNRIQLTTDGLKVYLEAVDYAFGGYIDYSMLIKIYGSNPAAEKRYSPAQCIGCETKRVVGSPDPNHINTSYVERQNLSVRMTNRRFTRLTNAFSKKIEYHIAAIALGYFACNFIKTHRTLRVTPAMAAGVTDRLWDVENFVAPSEASERRAER